jgi:alkaline phosphatase D
LPSVEPVYSVARAGGAVGPQKEEYVTRGLVRLALGAFALALLAAPAAEAAGFRYGVTSGDVTRGSAILWGRADQTGTVVLEVARGRAFHRDLKTYELEAKASNDLTVQRKVRGLVAGKRYWFRFRKGSSKSQRGTFVTAPARSADKTIRFAFSGDTDFTPGPGGTRPFWNRGGVFRRMRLERNAFNIHLGDTIYSDSEVPGRLQPIALRVGAKWAKYKLNLGNGHLVALRKSAGFYSVWDDHEFMNDFSRKENVFSSGRVGERATVTINGETLYKRGVRAFRDYAPVTYTDRDGIYRRVRWGRNLELFFLDQRSFRSAKASKGGVCDNPQTGRADQAPTGPQSVRNVFGAAIPSTGLTAPVSRRCLAALRSHHQKFLGRRQYRRFTDEIERSTARFKVIVNELPIQQYYIDPYDRWEGYVHERRRLLRFLRDHVKNAIFLTTDVHATLVNPARFQTLEPGGVKSSGIFDFTVGPAATENYSGEIDGTTGSAGSGALVDAAFLEPQPPAGIGMRCSIVNQFSYGEVRVTRNRLTVIARGGDGKQQPGCPPLQLNHR